MAKLSLLSIVLSLLVAFSASAPTALSLRQFGDTANDLVDGSPCKELLLIFARGTLETGNIGTLVGPLLGDSLITDLGAANVAVQGVDYPADIAGFLVGGDPGGSATMADLVTQAISQCPSSRIVMGGYSQGGQLVHNAAKTFSAATTAKIAAVVIFGDPDDGTPTGNIPAAKVDTFCHVGDDICLGGDLILPPHLDYGENTPAAAGFIVATTGL